MNFRLASLVSTILMSPVMGESTSIELPERLPSTGFSDAAFVYTNVEELQNPWWQTDRYGRPLDNAKWDSGALKNYERTIGLHHYITSQLLPTAVNYWTDQHAKLRSAGKKTPRNPVAFDENKYLDLILVAQGENEFERRRSIASQRELFQKATFSASQELVCFTKANLSAYDFERRGYSIKASPVQFAHHRPNPTEGINLRGGNTMGAALPSVVVKQQDDYYRYGFFLEVEEAEAEKWSKDHGKLLTCGVVSIVKPSGFVFNTIPRMSNITVELKAAGLYVQTAAGCVLLKKFTEYKSIPGKATPQQSFAVPRPLEADSRFLPLPQ